VPFGEAYLSWSDAGLALATIGQGYYDQEILAFDGAFPLSEAYRLELDVDAGGGPRRFTLYFIPPDRRDGVTRTDEPAMRVELCEGPPASAADQGCTPVPGAQALYFGANQPRLVGEVLIPWSALGIAGAPADHRLHLALSASNWFRAQSMSLSGRKPAAVSADSAAWATLRLGSAPR